MGIAEFTTSFSKTGDNLLFFPTSHFKLSFLCEKLILNFISTLLKAWARVSRAGLLEDIAHHGMKLLQDRFDRAQRVILQFSDSTSGRKHPLSSYNAFCLLPEAVISRDSVLVSLAHRLTKMDKICSNSLYTFRTMLPELESRTYAQRRHMLHDILKCFDEWMNACEPPKIEEGMLWVEFCNWYAGRHSAMSDLEKEYGTFVEDEREREGRLFRRWCLLALADSGRSNGGNVPGDSTGVGGHVYEGTVDGLLTPAARAALLSPRSIKAFIKYFALSVIASR